MHDRVAVLDHGYVQLITVWGSDQLIIESARMSTDKGFLGWKGEDLYVCTACKYSCAASILSEDQRVNPIACPNDQGMGDHSLAGPLVFTPARPGDEKLLKYLYEHKHSTPFEFGGMTVEIQAPLFVFREWHRHRTQSYSELSARYTPLPDVNYVPTVERLMQGSGTNKQAQSTGAALTLEGAETFRRMLNGTYKQLEEMYQLSLSNGVPKELARVLLPVGRYSRMRASANLRNWLAFLTLRMDAAAQWEIRQFANEVAKLIERFFPRTYELFAEGRAR